MSMINRLQEIINLGFSVYIFDNSPELAAIRDFSKKPENENIEYLTCGKNVGLGYGITALCAHAYYDSFKGLVFFDQDTIFKKITLEFIEDFFVNNQQLQSQYSAIVFNSKNINEQNADNKYLIKDVLLAISSGSLFYLDNVKKINWHNEKYFVDCVDYEFCLRSHNFYFKIGEYSKTPGFDHETEQPDVIYKFLGKKILLRKYSMTRITDAVSASLRLIWASVKTTNFLICYTMIRFLILYLAFQLLARIMNVYKPQEETAK